ncbi:ATP-binding cassette domain-containing protein [Aureimonas sp. AU22]|uniref:ATP-binding cassette domain-containing protein n=1 Tax=Aureimonas sp. AU22 TaxID=1638162 RepID=UPI0007829E07|nr:ATP-binding cassette domain-containing protein [Aureimonas sp. AU22]
MTLVSPPPRPALAFALEAVSFAVPGRVLLHPLDLDLASGRVVGLVGHNGSGKSTLVKLLARQERPSAGRVSFGGRDLAAWGERDFARHVAYLPQMTPPAPGLLVRDLAALGRYPWHGPFGRFSAGDRAHVEDALAATGTLPLADRPVDALSGGERQRAWLAMLVAQDAGCLLLDEPISALDVAHQIEVLGLVRALSRSRGVGVVVVLHDINMAARFCDEIVALKGGRLVARGRPDEVVTAAALERIYGVPMAILDHPGRPEPVAIPL